MSGRTLKKTLALSAALLGFAACAPNTGGSLKSAADLNAGIIGGKDADGTEAFAKTTVLLYDLRQGAMCTGTIASENLIVTAAHCVSASAGSMLVIFGKNFDDQNKVIRPVVQAFMSDKYLVRATQLIDNGDIGLVSFMGGLPAGYEAAEFLSDATLLKDAETISLAGYGLSDGVGKTGAGILRSVDTTILSAAYSPSEVLVDQSKGVGACHGDSGGPAWITVDGKRLVFGVTSRGVNDPDDHCNAAAVYTSIAAYADWVKTEGGAMSALVAGLTDQQKMAVAARANREIQDYQRRAAEAEAAEKAAQAKKAQNQQAPSNGVANAS